MLLIDVFKPFLFILAHEVAGVLIPPAALMAGFEMLATSLLSSAGCGQLCSFRAYLEKEHIDIVGDLLRHQMHVMSNDYSSDHVYNIVRADTRHHKPLIAHNKEHQVVHLKPLASPVLQGNDEAGADVP